jgi:hypothetical protein
LLLSKTDTMELHSPRIDGEPGIKSSPFLFLMIFIKIMKHSGIVCVLLVVLCITLVSAGCTSAPATPASPASTPAASAPVAAVTTPACPDPLVWDGIWDSASLGMAGNHDLSTAYTKYTDRVYGDQTTVTMSQKCRDVTGSMGFRGTKCNLTFAGTIENNTLSGTWSGSPTCSKGMDDRRFSLAMAADNKSWLGDLYDSSMDPSKFPPNWAGRRL